MGLPRIHRLRHRQDFADVYRGGLRRSTACMTLRALPPQVSSGYASRSDPESAKAPSERGLSKQANSQQSEAIGTNVPDLHAVFVSLERVQIGVVVSLKVSKRAVVRNRIRRRIHAAIYSLVANLQPGWRLVIITHPQVTQCNYVEILQQLEKLLVEVKVFHGHS